MRLKFNILNMIYLWRFSTQRSRKSQSRSSSKKHLRRNVISHLRLSAFIRGSKLPALFIFDKNLARLESIDSRRVTADVTPGRLWGHGGAPPGDFMKAAVRILSLLSCRNMTLVQVLIHVGYFGNMSAPDF